MHPDPSSPRSPLSTLGRAAALLVALALSGCATRPADAPVDAPAARPTADAAALLVAERQWLQSWFKDTPVAITQRGAGPVAIEIPREFSFEAGKDAVKPALGAVLDKVAESLRRVPSMRLRLLAAPGDAAGDSPLALRRAAQLRRQLVARGVPAEQIGDPQAAAAQAVLLQLVARGSE